MKRSVWFWMVLLLVRVCELNAASQSFDFEDEKGINHVLVILDAPLLFEFKLDKICALSIVVAAAPETQLKRVIARDAIDSAKAKGIDVVLVDTAGRMQNKTNLMNELNKVRKVTNPHLTLFVGDSLAGNDAVEQAQMFQEIMRFDGAVLTKMDTDAKGGAGLSIAFATGRPIVFAGVGQGYDDLLQFDPDWLLDQLFE